MLSRNLVSRISSAALLVALIVLPGCSVNVKDKNGKSVALTAKTGKEVRGSDTADHYKNVFKFRKGSFDGQGSEYVDINPSANK